jgi:hypothetical protein
MKLLKSHSLLSLANSYVIDSPQPSNLNYTWNFGSLLALCLGIQIVTGVTLAMKMCVAIKFYYMLESLYTQLYFIVIISCLR